MHETLLPLNRCLKGFFGRESLQKKKHIWPTDWALGVLLCHLLLASEHSMLQLRQVQVSWHSCAMPRTLLGSQKEWPNPWWRAGRTQQKVRVCSAVLLCPLAWWVNRVPVQPHRVIQSIIKCELENRWPRTEERQYQYMARVNVSAGAFLFSADWELLIQAPCSPKYSPGGPGPLSHH